MAGSDPTKKGPIVVGARRVALMVGALLLAPLVLAPAAAADFDVVRDCFGNPLPYGWVLVVPPGGNSFYGTSGDDVIIGTDGDDIIHGEDGEDIICAGGGDDLVWGGDHGDHIDGEAGGDFIDGDNGDDHLYGGPNAASGLVDFIVGDDGADEMYGGGGPDTLYCGAGAIPWDVGDHADGGTGMPAGRAESDLLGDACDTSVNFP